MKKLAILSFALFIAGCSTNNFQYTPEVDSITVRQADQIPMSLKNISVTVSQDAATDKFFFNVEGKNNYEAKVTTAFTKALEESLAESKVFRPTSKSASLKATIVEFSQLSMGLNFPTKLVTHYQLTDNATGKVLFDKEITTDSKVALTTAYLGTTRAIDARNLAVQKNISELLVILKNANIR